VASEFCNTNITSVESISEIAVPIFARYPAIEKAWVFGSFARQDQGPESDVDISLLIEIQVHPTSHRKRACLNL
jgi:predicted nucleotidyltransferase